MYFGSEVFFSREHFSFAASVVSRYESRDRGGSLVIIQYIYCTGFFFIELVTKKEPIWPN